MKVRINNEVVSDKLRMRIRLDYRAEEKSGRFLFGGKTNEAMAEAVREQQMNILKNVPLQGVTIQEFDTGLDTYLVTEEVNKRTREAAYAPLVLTLKADHIEDVLPLLLKTAFRKVEMLGPENVSVSKQEMERLMFTINKLFRQKESPSDQ